MYMIYISMVSIYIFGVRLEKSSTLKETQFDGIDTIYVDWI